MSVKVSPESPKVPIPPPVPSSPAVLTSASWDRFWELVRTFDPDHARSDELVKPMPGGASTRRYFRVALPTGPVVAMFVPDGPKPEEIDNAQAGHRWPFLEVRDLLSDANVPVPRILAEDTDAGWLILEDLGDDTLAEYLKREPSAKPALYTQAVRDLARAQQTLEALPEGCVVARRAFDETLLRWEIEHFREWGVHARGFSFSPEDDAAFSAIADRLAQRVASYRRGFVHRDYQSRNIMVRTPPGKGAPSLVWIDFQDALLGPRAYDLVALLGDSYQEFDRPFIEARLDEFAEARGLSASDRAELGHEFDYVTVQRKLKDAGRFVFIDREKGNPSFLRFVTPTIKKVAHALARLTTDPDMRALDALLRRALPQDMAI
ncbi:MAG: phosphotransferase [Polyangiaceae bacterium]